METDNALVDLLGHSFLCFVLGVGSDAVLSVIFENPSGPQRQVLDQLGGLLACGGPDENEFARQIDLANSVGYYVPDGGHSVANLLHLATETPLPELPKASDPVIDRLFALLLEIYPVLLLPQKGHFGSRAYLGALANNHPGRDALEEAIRQDPELTKLFSEHSEQSGWVGSVMRSTGVGGWIQIWGFAEQQITTAWEHAKLDLEVPSAAEVAHRLGEQIGVIRKAAQGKELTVPVRMGLAGVLLPESVDQLDLGWARLRRANERDQAFAAKTGIEGQLQTMTPSGDTIVIDYTGDVVVELQLSYIVRVEDLNITKGWTEDLSQAYRTMTEKIESLRLGLVLALDTAEPVNAVTSWQLILDPLAEGVSPGWSDTRQVPNLIPRQLTEDEVNDWVLWAKRVQEHRTASTAVSLRRLLQAIAERRNPEDVLVDAVIVWENLFGAAQETTLRISTSLAWLLGSDADDRAARQKIYKTLYSARSGIVHGSSRVKADRIPEQARQAVSVSIAALRKVFCERTDLLEISRSDDRSTAVMLDRKS